MKKGEKKRYPFAWCTATKEAARAWFIGVATRLNVPYLLSEIENTVFAPTGLAVCKIHGQIYAVEIAIFDPKLGAWQLTITL
jgi:hypothetical protein